MKFILFLFGGLQIKKAWIIAPFSHLLVMSLWASSLSFLLLSFLKGKTEIIKVH